MNRDYGIDINIDLTKEKIKDLNELVELYSKLGYLRTQFVKMQKTLPDAKIKIGGDIKKASEWVKELSTKLESLAEQYYVMTGATGNRIFSDVELGNKATSLNIKKFESDFDNAYRKLLSNIKSAVDGSKKHRDRTRETKTEVEGMAKAYERIATVIEPSKSRESHLKA